MTREEAIKWLQTALTSPLIYGEYADAIGMAIEALADRPTGEWTDNHNGTFTCDQCGCKHSKSNYCPNCGTRMTPYKGGEDE